MRHPPRSTLFPYPTLFRSVPATVGLGHELRNLRAALVHHVVGAHAGGGVDQPAPAARVAALAGVDDDHRDVSPRRTRSEEHTSELQSRQYLVCRLLLEKKK